MHDREDMLDTPVPERFLAHSYHREIYVQARPAAEPEPATWSDIWQALAGFIVLGILFVGLFVLWPVMR